VDIFKDNAKLFSFQKRDVSKKAVYMLRQGCQVWVPLCPDYVTGGIGDGVSGLMLSAIEAAKEVQSSFPKTSFLFLLADTEGDIASFGFNRENIRTSSAKIGDELRKNQIVNGEVSLFLDLWPDWHVRQYTLESQIFAAHASDEKLKSFFESHSEKRQERYSVQYSKDRLLSLDETWRIQVRHYAQYLLLQELMREQGCWILMNYLTENLRAITGYHSFLLPRRKVELIAY
jgi:hypothetical protein